MKKINKESQSQQARGYSMPQMGTNKNNRSKLRGIKPIWSNKRGWLRIIEAFIAILIITGGVLVVLSKKSIDNNSPDRVYEKQKYILDIIIKNNNSREYIIQKDVKNLNNQIRDMVPNNWNFTTSICEIGDICNDPNPPTPNDREVYATEIIVTSTLNEYSPKKIRFFVWAR